MAVQAQYPSNTLVPDFRSRVRHSVTNENRNLTSPGSVAALGTLHDVLPQPVVANLLRAYNTGLSNGHQTATDGGIVLNEIENDLARNSPASRKRPREGEDSLARQHAFIPVVDFHQNNANSPIVISQAGAAISTGLRLALEDCMAASTTSTSGRVSNGSTLSSVLSGDLQSQMLKQSEEIAQYIQIQGERMKQAIEEKRQRHTRTLFAVIEERVMQNLKDKNAELEKVNRRNSELEERVKQLSLESQLWQNMARNNEIMASNLRSSLEQVVAQSREQSKEGCGESEVDDAESCHYGEAGDAQARTFQENKELKEQRTCRVCRTNSACILLLPCRHLCLCKDCDGRLGVCPICRSAKNASVQVYMS